MNYNNDPVLWQNMAKTFHGKLLLNDGHVFQIKGDKAECVARFAAQQNALDVLTQAGFKQGETKGETVQFE